MALQTVTSPLVHRPTLWFLSDREGHQTANHVFFYSLLTGKLTASAAWVNEPNRLAFAPKETLLYVSDTSSALLQIDDVCVSAVAALG